jgi:hypothetical protein
MSTNGASASTTLAIRSGLMPNWTEMEAPAAAAPFWRETSGGRRRHVHELLVGADAELQALVEAEHVGAITAIATAAMRAWRGGDGGEARRLAHAAALLSQEIVGFWPASLNTR